MPLDTGIYQQQRPFEGPSLLDSVGKSINLSQAQLQMKQLQRENAEQDAVRESFSKNIGPDGQINRPGVLSDLAKTAPMKSLQVQGQFADMDKKSIELQKEKLQDQIDKMGLAYSMAASSKDQPSYDAVLQRMQGMGMDTSHMPAQFDPGYMRRLAVMSLKQSERLAAEKQFFDEAAKTREIGQKDRELTQGDRKLGIMDRKVTGQLQQTGNKTIDELRKERSALPVTKASQEVAVSYNKVRSSAKDSTGASDVSLIFSYMKMLDPGSVVREGEYATATNTAGIPGWIASMYNKAVDGQFLTPTQRQNFVSESGKVYKAQKSQQDKVDANFTAIANKRGIDPRDVLLDFNADPNVNPAAEEAKKLAAARAGAAGTAPAARAPQGAPPMAAPPARTAPVQAAPPPPPPPPKPGMVRMSDPNGVMRDVPAEQVEAAKAAGGKEL